jgi:hypothetical protein
MRMIKIVLSRRNVVLLLPLALGLLWYSRTQATDPPPRTQPIGKLKRPASAVDASRFKLSDQALADIRATQIENRLAALEKQFQQQIRALKDQNAALRKDLDTQRGDIVALQAAIRHTPPKGYSYVGLSLDNAMKQASRCFSYYDFLDR